MTQEQMEIGLPPRDLNPDRQSMSIEERHRAQMLAERRWQRYWVQRAVKSIEADTVEDIVRFICMDCVEDRSWRAVFVAVSKMPVVRVEAVNALQHAWIISKMFARRIGNRPLVAEVLRKVAPGYQGPGLQLFRGGLAREHKSRRYGFSWTTDKAVARDFAESYRLAGDVVVVTTNADPSAILWVREGGDNFDESEVVVDPFKVRGVRLIERLPMIERERQMPPSIRILD